MEGLDVECYKETCEKILGVIFDQVKDKQIIDIKLDFENLTPESVLYWRCKCDHLKKIGVCIFTLIVYTIGRNWTR